MNHLSASQINPPADQAAQNRARQAIEHAKLIKRAEAAVWRREQALQHAVKPKAIAKAQGKLHGAQHKLQLIRINGSMPHRNPPRTSSRNRTGQP